MNAAMVIGGLLVLVLLESLMVGLLWALFLAAVAAVIALIVGGSPHAAALTAAAIGLAVFASLNFWTRVGKAVAQWIELRSMDRVERALRELDEP